MPTPKDHIHPPLNPAALTRDAVASHALKRPVPQLIDSAPPYLELGPGRWPVAGTYPLERPDWDPERGDPIPRPTRSVGGVFAFHFFEHLRPPTAVRVLGEVLRVLRPRGTLVMAVPRAGTELSFHDLEHASWWNEDSFGNLLDTGPEYYDRAFRNWEDGHALRVHDVWLQGVVARNLMVFAQLVKVPAEAQG